MRPAIWLVAVAALAVGACAPAPQEPTVDIAAETAALRDAVAAYNEAGEAKNAAAMAALYADNAVAFPPNEATLEGPGAFEAFVEEVAGIEGFALAFGDTEVVVGAGGDLGYSIGPASLTMPGPDGEMVTTDERDVHIWRKQADGSWKIVVDIWNAPAPPAAPEAAESTE